MPTPRALRPPRPRALPRLGPLWDTRENIFLNDSWSSLDSETPMPAPLTCAQCLKILDVDTQDYVIANEQTRRPNDPNIYVHSACYEAYLAQPLHPPKEP
jgi:hypothetical protein